MCFPVFEACAWWECLLWILLKAENWRETPTFFDCYLWNQEKKHVFPCFWSLRLVGMSSLNFVKSWKWRETQTFFGFSFVLVKNCLPILIIIFHFLFSFCWLFCDIKMYFQILKNTFIFKVPVIFCKLNFAVWAADFWNWT